MSLFRNQVDTVEPAVARVLEDLDEFSARIGSASALGPLSAGVAGNGFAQIVDSEPWRQFVHGYFTRVLCPIDLPAICQSYQFASRGEAREIVLLDTRLAGEKSILPFAAASQTVGSRQLRRLRPLRDQRLVQRYWEAVTSGDARGWHSIVYGIVLAVYSLPLRQGLMHYGTRTLHSLAAAAGRKSGVASDDPPKAAAALLPPLTEAVDALLRPIAGGF